VIPFLAFPPEVRRVIYTTNAIEALNRQLRKAIKTKGHFPNCECVRVPSGAFARVVPVLFVCDSFLN
jgi:transposase-like protein